MFLNISPLYFLALSSKFLFFFFLLSFLTLSSQFLFHTLLPGSNSLSSFLRHVLHVPTYFSSMLPRPLLKVPIPISFFVLSFLNVSSKFLFHLFSFLVPIHFLHFSALSSMFLYISPLCFLALSSKFLFLSSPCPVPLLS